jgi:lipoprotein NlpD
MVVAVRLVCLLLALLLSSCYSTRLPGTGASSQPRQKVTVHSKSKVSRKAARPVVYTVRPNDTLYSIGKRFGVDYHTISRRNRLRSPYRIYVGQHLYITRVAPRSHALPIARHMYQAPVKTAKKKQAVKKKKGIKPSKPSHKTKARSYAGGRLLWPVKGKVTSLFGRRGSRMHDGIDISAKEGTPIHVAAAGTVVYADHRLSGYGKLVIVRHGRNLFTTYAHNQRNLVQKGATVRKGDVIARVGRTGRASGAHLHFEVRHGSTAVDPLAYLPRR